MIVPEGFNMFLKKFCFVDFWKVSVVPVFKKVEERYMARNYHPVSLFSMVKNY